MKNRETTLGGYRQYACAALTGLLARDVPETFCVALINEQLGAGASRKLTRVQIINLAAELLAIEAESHERDGWIALREEEVEQ